MYLNRRNYNFQLLCVAENCGTDIALCYTKWFLLWFALDFHFIVFVIYVDTGRNGSGSSLEYVRYLALENFIENISPETF